MTAPAAFYLITDDAREACLTLFARDPQFAPAFVTVVTELGQLVAIPAGARAIGLWFRKDGVLRQVWREQVRHQMDCGRRWQIFDEVAAWRAALWREVEEAPAAATVEAPAVAAPAAGSEPVFPKRVRWS